MSSFSSRRYCSDLVGDGAQVILHPVVQPEAEVTASQRTFHHDEVGQAVGAGVLAQEQLQRAQRRDDDAQLDVAETRVVFDQRKRAQMQAGRQGDAVDAGGKRFPQPHLERLFRRVHGELFHAVDEDHAGAALGFHGLAHMQTGGFGDMAEIELHLRLVGIVDVVFVLLQLGLDEVGVVVTIRNGRQHGIRNMTYAAQTGSLQCQFCCRNVHAHAADHDRDQLLFAELQAEIIYTFHCFSRS